MDEFWFDLPKQIHFPHLFQKERNAILVEFEIKNNFKITRGGCKNIPMHIIVNIWIHANPVCTCAVVGTVVTCVTVCM